MNLIEFAGFFVPFKKALTQKLLYNPVIKQKNISVENPPLFDTVFFEVRSRCNGLCSFCAASVKNEIREDISMSKELYLNVINQLKEMNYRGRIAFHNNNDPLIFKNLIEFITIAREHIPEAAIQILTNGKALNVELAEKLIKAGIHDLSITYYNDDLKSPPPEKFIKIISGIIPKYYNKDEILIKGFGDLDVSNKQYKFRYYISRRLENEILTSRAGTAPNKGAPKKNNILGFCQYPWTQFIVCGDGKVPMCCSDLHYKVVIGNTQEQSVMDIWNGKKARSIRTQLLNGNRDKISTCSQCDYVGVKSYSKAGLFKRFLYKVIS